MSDRDLWAESRDVTDLIRQQAEMLALIITDGLVEHLRKAESVGSIFDPTGFIKHGRSVEAALRILIATQRWIGEVRRAVKESAR